MSCKICNQPVKQIYTPVGSKINLQVVICTYCGLVQSEYDIAKYEQSNIPKQYAQFSHLSCNADYSDVRVGKQQMTSYVFKALQETGIDLGKSPKILDMKSARGHFVKQALQYFNLSDSDYIDCIEEDGYMTVEYDNNDQCRIFRDKYHKLPITVQYDLIYSCHSLEHYQNPKKVVTFLRNILRPGGFLYIDVPNLENINHLSNLDEFFYDKHLFYFDVNTLQYFIEQVGFKLLYKHTNSQNIGMLFEKVNISQSTLSLKNNYDYNCNLIHHYAENLHLNRTKIESATIEINKIFKSYSNNSIIGCGRVLDAFLQYGKLDLDNIQYLVDDFLISATTHLYNKKLLSVYDLKEKNLDNVLLLVKHPTEKLLKNINALNIIYLSDILA